ncbi:MAG: hypothetical protein A3B25_02755 [Candidatus Ryanbacteria bacterium RIFCSPLOWO2_01_FULL_48_26]|uniref:Uncharacterized protein n=1 Tax=Candidatus Ryanbacteria bacterium RIFCSPLOWO2_01_FULL_48_26 TaxID=1802126 RepID=A0A1G2GUU4_9BACT|nr:MAG: hypothetical protein A3B25_02755 [Candidatus Ryanbacteria bacterium RIFCSPLOWO2_01_FULL_48_26]
MENPFEKKPITLIISLAAIILLILGAGIISSYFGKPAETTAILPDSPYSITWENTRGNLILREGETRQVRTKFSLLNIQQTSTPDGKIATSSRTLILTIAAFILDQSSSTSKTCTWKLPISLRRVSDELGTLVLPTETFLESTPITEHCVKPGFPTIAKKNIVFPIPETEHDFLFTTDDDPSHILFSAHLNADETIDVEQIPQEIPG